MRTIKKGLALCMIMCIVFATVPVNQVEAAAVESVNQKSVYQKQNMRGTCTLSAVAMMLRRAALYDGNTKWNKIKESTIRSSAWMEGVGLKWNFSYTGMKVQHGVLPGGKENKSILKKLLTQHPEGIVLYDRSVPHAVLLTDYTKGIFYCADPTPSMPKGRIRIDQAYQVKIEKATAFWFVEQERFTVGNLIYQTIHSESGKKQVQVIGMKDQKQKSISIPATVKRQGKKYSVIRIAEKALENKKNLESATIGKNITSIGTKAFYGSLNLKKVKINTQGLSDVGMNAFMKIAEKAVLFVPVQKKLAYQTVLKESNIGPYIKIK